MCVLLLHDGLGISHLIESGIFCINQHGLVSTAHKTFFWDLIFKPCLQEARESSALIFFQPPWCVALYVIDSQACADSNDLRMLLQCVASFLGAVPSRNRGDQRARQTNALTTGSDASVASSEAPSDDDIYDGFDLNELAAALMAVIAQPSSASSSSSSFNASPSSSSFSSFDASPSFSSSSSAVSPAVHLVHEALSGYLQSAVHHRRAAQIRRCWPLLGALRVPVSTPHLLAILPMCRAQGAPRLGRRALLREFFLHVSLTGFTI